MPQAAKQQVVQVGPAPKVEGQGALVDRAVEQLKGVANKVIDLHDFTEGQKTELERRQITDAASEALQAKMALPYDDPESLYTPDGRVDEGKLNAFVSEWQQKCNNVQSDFWRAENIAKDQYRQLDDADRLSKSLRTAVLGRELQNRKQYFADNLELAMLKKDWPGAERAAKEARAGGLLTEIQLKNELQKIKNAEYEHQQKGHMQMAQQAALNGGKDFALLYDNPDFYNKLSDENKAKLDLMAQRQRGEAPQRKVHERQREDGSTELVAEAPEAPRGLPSGLVAKWNKHGGKFDSPEAAEDARGELLVYLRGIVQHKDDPIELEQAKAICKQFGHSDTFATQVVTKLRSEIDDTAKFNAREAMKAFTGKHRFLRAANTEKVQSLTAKRDSLRGIERNDQLKDELTLLEEQVKKWERWSANADAKASREIFEKFDQWAISHPDASYKEQARAFYDFAYGWSMEDAVTGNADETAAEETGIYETALLAAQKQRLNEGKALQEDITKTNALRDKAAAAADDEAKKRTDKAAGEEAVSNLLDNARGVSNNWEGNSDEPIVYVPTGHPMAGKTVSIATPDGAESYAKVVEEAGCEAPVLSQHLRWNLGVLNNPYSTLTFDGGRGVLNNGELSTASAATAKSLGGLSPYYGIFMDAAVRNDIDPKLLMAIAMHETGRGSSTAFYRKNNAMGVSDANGPRSFKKVEDSIYLMARLLKKNYIDQGLTSIEQIGRKYAPIGAENDKRGLNKHWVEGVTKYMRELTK